MKTNIELAREAGVIPAEVAEFVDASDIANLDRYTALVEARLMDRLLEGAGEPARIEQELYGDEFRYYTPDQIAAAVLREREECAMVCENMWGDDGDANDFAQAIRNRGTK